MESKKLLQKIENTKRANLILLRKYAKDYLEMVWEELCEEQMASTTSLTDMEHNTVFHEAIWYASTEILPSLEIQVVIDDNWKLHISSGTAGFVGFPNEPKGLKLPIRCWIHTHPFGLAYFSSVDWRTISIWGTQMETAYVLGDRQYGHWVKHNPEELSIYTYDEWTDKDWKRVSEHWDTNMRIQVKDEDRHLPEPTGDVE